MPPFSQVSISPYLMSPSWELQGGDQSLLPVGVGTDWGLAPGPYLILWPFLVSWSVPPVSPFGARPSGESGHQSERDPEYHQAACLLIRLGVPSLQPSQATSLAAQGVGMVGILLGPPEMLLKPLIKKPSTTLRELENSGLLRWWAQRS